MGIPGIPFQQNQQPPEDGQSQDSRNRKKRRFPIDDLNSLKKPYEEAQKIVKYARWAANPGAITAIVIFVVIFITFFLNTSGSALTPGGDSSEEQVPDNPAIVKKIPGLTLTLTGPVNVNNDQDLEYAVEVTYTGSAPPLSDIIVYSVIPTNTIFVNASGAYTYFGNEIAWPMSQNASTFTFTLRPTVPDIEIVNQVFARTIPATGSVISPNYTDCGNSYYAEKIAQNPDKINFGDPNCDFDEAKLYALLQEKDPQNAEFWYKCALLESSYIPVNYAPPSSGTPDAAGAWGLFQMGRGKNGPTDHGDVDWTNQTTNAIAHSKLSSSFKDYWQCARDMNYDGVK